MTKRSRPFLLTVSCCWWALLGSLTAAQEKPLKVFILVGQSNMQGHAHVRTLPHMGMSPETKPLLDEIQNANGDPRIAGDIWISYLSTPGTKTGRLTTGFGADESKIGPELTFGIFMQKRLKEPILIIKTAWGGKSLHTDFRPPSAGPFVFDETARKRLKQQGIDLKLAQTKRSEATGAYYRQTIEHVQRVLADIQQVKPDYSPKQGYELAGMVWFQGWNDMVDQGVYPHRNQTGGYAQYSTLMAHLIRDFRKDLAAPELPFVIGVIGVDGPTDQYPPNKQRYVRIHQNFRDAMAAPANSKEFQDNVALVLTENCWDMELEKLIARENEIKLELKKRRSDGKAEATDWRTALDQQKDTQFTERERKILETGVSNAAYHYLGCAKIMAQIGKRFAEAMPLDSSN